MLWFPLRLCLSVVFGGAILGQVVGVGVYVDKFAGGPEQGIAQVGLAVGLLTLAGAEALVVSTWVLVSRFRRGYLFERGSMVWLTVVTAALTVFVLPFLAVAVAVAVLMTTVGEDSPPVYVAGVVGIGAFVAAGAMSMAVLTRAFKDAVAARVEVEAVI